jgi:hypothetical protein
MDKAYQYLHRASLVFWPALLAFAIQFVWSIKWWHPACNIQTDGEVYAAYGTPLPFEQPSGASSTHASFMPHILALNVLFLAAVVFPLTRLLLNRMAAVTRLASVVFGVVGTILFIVSVIGALIIYRSPDLYYPTLSLADAQESYFAYRPHAIAVNEGNHSCY